MNAANGPRNWRSGCSAVVVSEQSTETFTAFDGAGRGGYFVARINQQVFQPLMISFLVIMRFEFAKRLVQFLPRMDTNKSSHHSPSDESQLPRFAACLTRRVRSTMEK